jgi:hypothetical protein
MSSTLTILSLNLYITKVLHTADVESAPRCALPIADKHACIPAVISSRQPAFKDKARLCCRCSQQRRASPSQRARVESGRHLPKARMMAIGNPRQSLCWHLLTTVLHQAAMVT